MRFVIGLAVAALSGCGVIGFDVDQDLPQQRVPGSVVGGILPGIIQAPIPLNIDLKSETQKRATGPATHAFLKSLTLAITPHAAPSGNFDFLDEAHIFIDAPNAASLPRVEIATLKPVPKGMTALAFAAVAGVDLLPYINAGAEITASATGREPPMDVTYDGHITVTVKL